MPNEIMPLEVLRHYLNECCTRKYDPKTQVMKWQPLVANDGVNSEVVKRSIETHMGFGAGQRGITLFGAAKLKVMEEFGFDVGIQRQPIAQTGRTLH